MGQITGSSRPDIGKKRSREQNNSTTFISFNGHSGSNIIDLSTEVPTSGSILDYGTSTKKRISNSYKNSSSDSNFVDSTSGSSLGWKPNHSTVHNSEERDMWECGACTLLNPVSDRFFI